MAVAVNYEGKEDVLGLWIAESEGAKFWMRVLTELKNRGVQDILIACMTGLPVFLRRCDLSIWIPVFNCVLSTWFVTRQNMFRVKT